MLLSEYVGESVGVEHLIAGAVVGLQCVEMMKWL